MRAHAEQNALALACGSGPAPHALLLWCSRSHVLRSQAHPEAAFVSVLAWNRSRGLAQVTFCCARARMWLRGNRCAPRGAESALASSALASSDCAGIGTILVRDTTDVGTDRGMGVLPPEAVAEEVGAFSPKHIVEQVSARVGAIEGGVRRDAMPHHVPQPPAAAGGGARGTWRHAGAAGGCGTW